MQATITDVDINMQQMTSAMGGIAQQMHQMTGGMSVMRANVHQISGPMGAINPMLPN
jgi:hypothetical protein